VDEDVWRSLEPGTAHPLQRLRAVRELTDAGIRAGVLMNPIVPGISSKPSLIERTVKTIAEHGAHFVGCNVMHLDGGTRDHFMRWLAHEYPHLVDGYSKLYAGKYAPSPYRKEVGSVVALMREKYGITPRDRDRDDQATRATSRQPQEEFEDVSAKESTSDAMTSSAGESKKREGRREPAPLSFDFGR
jgi:DNA repair photolyase